MDLRNYSNEALRDLAKDIAKELERRNIDTTVEYQAKTLPTALSMVNKPKDKGILANLAPATVAPDIEKDA